MKRRVTIVSLLLLTGLGLHALPASAHDPIILTDDQTEAETGPVLPDGTISFALYGSLQGEGDRRVFRVSFAGGDPLYLSLLIPDLSPENSLETDRLPYLEVLDPSGISVTLRPDERVPFAEPFSKTNYIRLIEMRDVALPGEYTVTVVGPAPARFTVAVGEKEIFGTPVEGVANRSLGVEGVLAWYATPPTVAATTIAPSTSSEVTSTSSRPTTLPVQSESSGDRPSGSAVNWVLVLVVAVVVSGAVVAIILRRRRR